MGRRRRCSALPPLPPRLLLILLSLATPAADAVTPRPVRGTLVQRLVGHAERNHLLGRHGGVNAHRQEKAAGLRRLMEWSLEDEEDDSDEGSGSISTPPPHATSLTPSATHRVRHDRGHFGDQRGDRRPQEMTAPSTQLLPVARLSTPQPASQTLVPFGIPRPAAPTPPPSPPRRRLRAHDACYSSNEVLLVVGVTCAVNFAFILVVVALVHLCNRGAAKVVPAAFEYEPQGDGDCRSRAAVVGDACGGVATAVGAVDLTGAGAVAAAYTRVQEYVDSLPDALSPFHREDDHEEAVAEEVVAAGCCEEGGGGEEAGLAGGRAPRRRSAHGLHTAFSMEQLLFVD